MTNTFPMFSPYATPATLPVFVHNLFLEKTTTSQLNSFTNDVYHDTEFQLSYFYNNWPTSTPGSSINNGATFTKPKTKDDTNYLTSSYIWDWLTLSDTMTNNFPMFYPM